jgi:hypothetical protein
MDILIAVFSIILGVFLIALMFVFSKALTARIITGKWPHEDEESKAIYDHLLHL